MGRRHNPTSTTIRKGYQKLDYWSLAECAEYSGLAVDTLYNHARAGAFKIIATPSPYKVYAREFSTYIHKTPYDEKKDKPRDLFSRLG